MEMNEIMNIIKASTVAVDKIKSEKAHDKAIGELANLAIVLANCGQHHAIKFDGLFIDCNGYEIQVNSDGSIIVSYNTHDYCNMAHWDCREVEVEAFSAREAFEICGQFNICTH